MAPGIYNFTVIKGDSVSLTLALANNAGIIPLTGYTATAKAKLDNSTTTALTFTCVVTEATGVIAVSATTTQTAALAAAVYAYDVHIAKGTERQTVIRGRMAILDSAT